MRRTNKGFTLIELIMVIVILGILAAFALPRFADMSSDAKDASIKGLAGSIKSAMAISHAAYLIDATSPASVTLDGISVALEDGYPTVASIITAAGITTTDWTYTTGSTARVAGVPDTAGIAVFGLASGCLATYTEAVDATPASATFNASC